MYIVGGKIVTMTGKDFPEGVIHIKNGRIAAIGSAKEIPVKPGEQEQMPSILWMPPLMMR